MGDGFWNPADYVFNRYEGGLEQQKGKTLFGNAFTKNYNKIPQEAQDYINEQIQECLNSGYKVTKWFLRALESRVKVRWPDQVPYNWDISSFISTDKGMAKAINKQNNSKRVGNTQEQVADAKPGDTVLYNGKSVALSENDINKAQQNTGANDPKTYADKQAQLEAESKTSADARASLTEASKLTEKEAALRANAQKALDEKNAQREQTWQDQQVKNQEQNEQAKTQALKQQSAAINQNTIDEINQGSTNVGDLATAVSEVSMPTMNTDTTTQDIHNLSLDEIKTKLKAIDPSKGLEWANKYERFYMEWTREKNNRDMSKSPKDKEKYERNMSTYQGYMDNILKEAGLL